MSTSLFTRRLRWTDVARLLDIGYESAALPALVTCPLCQGHALRVYDDRSVRGTWFHCRGCGRGGDTVTFAAAVWGVEPAAAVERFIAEGLCPASVRAAVPGYVAGAVERQRRMEEFWRTASQHLPGWESPGAARLARTLGVNTGLPVERWRAGLGTLVGAAPVREVERVFQPNVVFPGGGVLNPSAQRVFTGRGWRDVLVLPYHSAAGRLSGFGFVGRAGGPTDRAFAAVRSYEPAARKDAGLFGPHAAEGNPTVVAVRDDAFALRLHSRHFATSGRFLGLVAWRDDGTHATGRGCWQQLNGKRVVHWVPRIDAAVVRQAFFFEADVSTAGPADPSHAALLTYCRQADPPDLLRTVVRQARPWRYALADWLRDAHGGAVEAMAAQLAACGIDPHEVARSLPDPDAADRLHGLGGARHGRPGLRSVAFGSGTVEARPDGWYSTCYTGAGKPQVSRVSDFTLRVRQIRVLPDREAYDCEVYYRGRCHVVELDPRRPLARQLVRAGVGIVHIGTRWVGRVFKIATAFDEPVIVREP